ncbi:uncharacterized protein LOC124169044 isoform X2 [Ischnura elegans]|uniref:uncharacterized protein LOC124169044 isoform X2 n=1 Tax=Ischnura elegans TaxID=197161 RepID=UPI001ED8BF72|nr:uncharacterized protein LOC124169044 isoform X2 [Ischnura elegans]
MVDLSGGPDGPIEHGFSNSVFIGPAIIITCEDYRDDPGCPDVSNCTGILLPSPTKCNCCQYCLDYIEEGGECSAGVPGQASVQQICGPQLTCGKDNVCVKMKSPCMNKKAEFEEKKQSGTLGGGEIDPNCDDHGDYAPIQCIPGSICYCSSPTGERIFGEMINMYSDMDKRMDCACSIGEWRARNRIKRVAPEYLSRTKAIFARCISTGSYDMLQCVKNRCTCVDKKGIPQPSDANKPVKYVFETNLGNGNPWCFNLTSYKKGSFDTPCLREREEVLDLVKWLEKNEDNDEETDVNSIVIGAEHKIPQCDPDGSYSPVQLSWESKFCVDPEGKEIKGPDGVYSVPVDSDEAVDMDCKCARTTYLLNEWNTKVITETSKNKTANSFPPILVNVPKCCQNGNFAAWQCINGVCHCVDRNGAQLGPDVDREDVAELDCYKNNNRCPVSSP